jgi:hypothetical protein
MKTTLILLALIIGVSAKSHAQSTSIFPSGSPARNATLDKALNRGSEDLASLSVQVIETRQFAEDAAALSTANRDATQSNAARAASLDGQIGTLNSSATRMDQIDQDLANLELEVSQSSDRILALENTSVVDGGAELDALGGRISANELDIADLKDTVPSQLVIVAVDSEGRIIGPILNAAIDNLGINFDSMYVMVSNGGRATLAFVNSMNGLRGVGDVLFQSSGCRGPAYLDTDTTNIVLLSGGPTGSVYVPMADAESAIYTTFSRMDHIGNCSSENRQRSADMKSLSRGRVVLQ